MNKQQFGFPQQARALDDLLETIKLKKGKDIDWRKGRAFCLIYHPGDDREQVIKSVFDQYYADSALNPAATPSLAELETETVSMCADLFHGDEQVCGNITTGGTESIILAVKTARDGSRKNKANITQPHVVLSESAHPAFFKAFHLLNVDYTATKTGDNYEADLGAFEKAITANTILLVGSAPSYPYGVIDPISKIASLAKRKNLLCHVDACVGGFILPFIKELGYSVLSFDFEIEGVTSLSADLHKYGYAPKGASVILYRTHELRRFQFSLYTKWAGGVYGSPTITGTRAGGNIAAGWAAIRSIGREGYMEMAKATMETTARMKQAIEQIEGLELMGKTSMSIVACKSDKLDVYMIADELNKKGWHFERQQAPPSLHFTVNYIHQHVIEEFLSDLRQAADHVRGKPIAQLANRMQTAVVKGLSNILPGGSIARMQKGSRSEPRNENKAAMYGMIGALSGTGDLEEIVLDFLDQVYTAKK